MLSMFMRCRKYFMKFQFKLIFLLFLITSSVFSQDDENLVKAKDILYFINFARINPSGFANQFIFQRINDSEEAQECFDEMIKSNPVKELIWSDFLYQSAYDHAEDIGSNGLIGHMGSDSSDLAERVERYTGWKGSIGENIYYGLSSPSEIVTLFLIDEGIDDRGHRKNILNGKFELAGVAVYPHFYYGFVSVIHFAENLKQKN
jgi:uncharacterized protein YkwD